MRKASQHEAQSPSLAVDRALAGGPRRERRARLAGIKGWWREDWAGDAARLMRRAQQSHRLARRARRAGSMADGGRRMALSRPLRRASPASRARRATRASRCSRCSHSSASRARVWGPAARSGAQSTPPSCLPCWPCWPCPDRPVLLLLRSTLISLTSSSFSFSFASSSFLLPLV